MTVLYIVATPIGNLDDISPRAVSVLNSVDCIFAEDTRVTKILLDRFSIRTKLMSLHHHSGAGSYEKVFEFLKNNKSVAYVSDAGTPGINDPGGLLVQKVIQELPNSKIIPIPGPNAVVTALSVSGFPADKFIFLGFPPHKKGRQTFFKEIGTMESTIAFYESKHRILKALEQLRDVSQIGYRQIVVARELTKQFETIYRGTVDEILFKLNRDKVLGEFVVVVAPQRQVKSTPSL